MGKHEIRVKGISSGTVRDLGGDELRVSDEVHVGNNNIGGSQSEVIVRID